MAAWPLFTLCPSHMGEGDEFPVVVNEGLSLFDVSRLQSCRLQSKSVSSAADEPTSSAVVVRFVVSRV